MFNETDIKYECREDEASMQMAQLVITETVAKPVTLFGLAVVSLIKKILGFKKWKA